MSDTMFWRLIAILAISVGAYVGHGLHADGGSRDAPLPGFASRAYAEGAMMLDEDREVFITTGMDGRVIYLWEYRGLREPMLHATASVK